MPHVSGAALLVTAMGTDADQPTTAHAEEVEAPSTTMEAVASLAKPTGEFPVAHAGTRDTRIHTGTTTENDDKIGKAQTCSGILMALGYNS